MAGGPDKKQEDGSSASGGDLNKPNKLPPGLQKIVEKEDKEDSLYDELWEGSAPQSTDSSIRYAAYASRIRTALQSARRYVAYTSDIGESFRPVVNPNVVRTAYAISWLYLIGDVSHEGYKAYCQNQRILHPELPRKASQARYNDAKELEVEASLKPGAVTLLEDYRVVMAQRAAFQSIASMGLPAFTIHSIVRYSGRALKDVKNPRIRSWGPIGLGLATVPFLPYIFDKPVEEAVEWTFHKAFETFGGKKAIGDLPKTGRQTEVERGNRADTKGRKDL